MPKLPILKRVSLGAQSIFKRNIRYYFATVKVVKKKSKRNKILRDRVVS
jgi:hypothetical protein